MTNYSTPDLWIPRSDKICVDFFADYRRAGLDPGPGLFSTLQIMRSAWIMSAGDAVANSDDYNFLNDLIALLREEALLAKAAGQRGDLFDKGRQQAYYEVLSLIVQQAQAFGIPLSRLGIENFNPDSELL